MKLCECGCGNPAPIAKRTYGEHAVKGQPQRFILGHHPIKTHCKNGHLRVPENLSKHRGCKICRNNQQRERWQENPEKYREATRNYMRKRDVSGWTREETKQKMDEQKGICAIPGCTLPATHADHCHVTKKHRGLLCNGHNRGLGFFQDSPQMLMAAAEYLQKYQGE